MKKVVPMCAGKGTHCPLLNGKSPPPPAGHFIDPPLTLYIGGK